MFKVQIEDKNYENLGKARFFNTIEAMQDYLLTLLNPIEEGSWLEKNAKVQSKEYNDDFINSFFDDTMLYFRNGGTGSSGSIMNGSDNQSECNFGYNITKVETSDNYEQPLAWGSEPRNQMDYASIFEVFPEDYKAIKKAYDEWFNNIDEDCKDAQRIGIANNPESMELYGTFSSCCGSSDEAVTVNGILYMFGCNYGH